MPYGFEARAIARPSDLTKARACAAGAYLPNAAVNVLACHGGVVQAQTSNVTSGTGPIGNSVEQTLVGDWDEHLRGARYTAVYEHLAGPSQLLSSVGSWYDQGSVFGFVNNTGNSAWDHLHFEIHDVTLPSDAAGGNDARGRTTRLTPMDNQSLDGDGTPTSNDGDCIVSSNVVTSPRAFCRFLIPLASTPEERRRLEAICETLPEDAPLRLDPSTPGISDVLEPLPLPSRP